MAGQRDIAGVTIISEITMPCLFVKAEIHAVKIQTGAGCQWRVR